MPSYKQSIDFSEVIGFFDKKADSWDNQGKTDPTIINQILKAAEIFPNNQVLDVGCGTGILFPYYLQKSVMKITGIDISPEMIRKSSEKVKAAGWNNITLITGNVLEYPFSETFDRIVVYNAFPHLANFTEAIACFSRCMKPGGRLTIAHSQGRNQINSRHALSTVKISVPMIPAESLAMLFRPDFIPDRMVDNDQMYIVSGKKEEC